MAYALGSYIIQENKNLEELDVRILTTWKVISNLQKQSHVDSNMILEPKPLNGDVL